MSLRDRNITPLDRKLSAADVNNSSSLKSGERAFASLYAAMNLHSAMQIPLTTQHFNFTQVPTFLFAGPHACLERISSLSVKINIYNHIQTLDKNFNFIFHFYSSRLCIDSIRGDSFFI